MYTNTVEFVHFVSLILKLQELHVKISQFTQQRGLLCRQTNQSSKKIRHKQKHRVSIDTFTGTVRIEAGVYTKEQGATSQANFFPNTFEALLTRSVFTAIKYLL